MNRLAISSSWELTESCKDRSSKFITHKKLLSQNKFCKWHLHSSMNRSHSNLQLLGSHNPAKTGHSSSSHKKIASSSEQVLQVAPTQLYEPIAQQSPAPGISQNPAKTGHPSSSHKKILPQNKFCKWHLHSSMNRLHSNLQLLRSHRILQQVI